MGTLPPLAFGKRKLGLAERFSLLVTVILLLLGFQMAALLWISQREASNNYLRIAAQGLTDITSRQIAASVAAGDSAATAIALRGLRARPSVMHAGVVGADGRILYAFGQGDARLLAQARRVQTATSFRQGDQIWAVAPVILDERRVGATMVIVDRAVVKAGERSIFVGVLGILALTLALALPLAFLLVRRVTQPLRTLIAFAESATSQRLSERIDLTTGDEFETLAGAFNQMLGRLDASLKRVRRLAYTDPVTDLPNLERFQRDLNARLSADFENPRDADGAVILVSLDRLAQVKDGFGEEAAQELLALSAARLAAAARTADRVVRPDIAESPPILCARIGGSEFAILIPKIGTAQHAGRFAQLVQSAMSQPLDWRGQKVSLDCAAGIALIPRDGQDADALLRHARLALRAAVGEGRSVRYFTRALHQQANARIRLEREIREGLERNQFRAFFQPKIDLTTGKICGAEALARWIRPDQALVGPGVFIPAAEENGLIGRLSDTVLRDACWKAAGWAREGRLVKVAVNVSALQFVDEKFSAKVIQVLEQCGLPAELLELEITESIAMTNVDRVLRAIEPLRARGVTFAIDDFGTGHSSLASLSRLPFDVLKIDQQFVRGLSSDRHAPTIVETILGMAASLHFDTVAEGVEREEEAHFLRLRGCNLAQGFLYGAAMPPAEFLERLGARPTPAARAGFAA